MYMYVYMYVCVCRCGYICVCVCEVTLCVHAWLYGDVFGTTAGHFNYVPILRDCILQTFYFYVWPLIKLSFLYNHYLYNQYLLILFLYIEKCVFSVATTC